MSSVSVEDKLLAKHLSGAFAGATNVIRYWD